MMTLKEEKESLFDNDFNYKTTDVKAIIHFCDRLKSITGIHTCNHLGMTYEYLPTVYKSALSVENEKS